MMTTTRLFGAVALACALLAQAPAADASPDTAEYNRLRMLESMGDQRYNDRINAPVSNSSSSSSTSSGFGAPYQWKPRGPGGVVATYEFKAWVQETPAQAVARLSGEADAGNRQSQFDLGRVLYAGYREVPRDVPRARKLFLAAAAQDHPAAMSQAGVMLYFGQGGPEDKAGARQWVRKAAEEGDSYGEMLTGLWALIDVRASAGNDAAPAPEALSWLRKAAGHGELLAQKALHTVYFAGINGAKVEYNRAFAYAAEAAAQGDVDSYEAIAVHYMKGYGVAQDNAEAVKWTQRAADGGNSEGQANYSVMLSQGRLLPRDLTAGHKYAQMSAAQGDVNGQVLLAKSYYFGEGVQKNLVESARWFRKAAAQGNKEAADALAEPELQQAARSL